MSPIKLIVGLGNPGNQYQATRHNAGFWFIDRVEDRYRTRLIHRNRFFGQVGSIDIDGHQVYLLKPDTMMNLSGKSVQALASFYRIEAGEMLIAHDELDIGCGHLRLKSSGGHGGHNGLRDIVRCLGSNNFHRLRIGIGHPGHASLVTRHVLSNASPQEKQQIDRAIDRAVGELANIISGNFESAMQTLHAKTV